MFTHTYVILGIEYFKGDPNISEDCGPGVQILWGLKYFVTVIRRGPLNPEAQHGKVSTLSPSWCSWNQHLAITIVLLPSSYFIHSQVINCIQLEYQKVVLKHSHFVNQIYDQDQSVYIAAQMKLWQSYWIIIISHWRSHTYMHAN